MDSSPTFFRPGTRHMAIGDSITHVGTYLFYLQLFALTRFPDRSIEFLNAGIAGDSAQGGFARLHDDILSRQPTSASIMFGMNDVDRDLYQPGRPEADLSALQGARIADHARHTRNLVSRLCESGISVALITPTPFDETASLDTPNLPGVDHFALEACARNIEQIGREFDIPVIDFRLPLLEINRGGQQRDPRFTIIGPDRVHPEAPGHLIMAWLFLASQSPLPSLARLLIHGDQIDCTRCTIEDLHSTPDTISFRYQASSLPFPIDPPAQPALAWAPIHELNREILQIENLAPGSYQLLIDDIAIGHYSAAELATGLNLADYLLSPQNLQAHALIPRLREYWDLIQILRDIVLMEHASLGWQTRRPLSFTQVHPHLDAFLSAQLSGAHYDYYHSKAEVWTRHKPHEEAIKTQAAALFSQIQIQARPTPHHFTLRRITTPSPA